MKFYQGKTGGEVWVGMSSLRAAIDDAVGIQMCSADPTELLQKDKDSLGNSFVPP